MSKKHVLSIAFKIVPVILIVFSWFFIRYVVTAAAITAPTMSANPSTIAPNSTSNLTINSKSSMSFILSVDPNYGSLANSAPAPNISCSSASCTVSSSAMFQTYTSFSFVSNGTPGTTNIGLQDEFNAALSATTSVTILQPVLSVSPASVSFAASVGGATSPASQNVNLTTSVGTITYTTNVSYTPSGVSWLTVTPATNPNAVTNGTPNTISLSANSSGLTVGSYTAMVTFRDKNNTDDFQNVTVTFNVTQPPALLTVSPNTFNFTGTAAKDITAGTIMLSAANGSITYTVGSVSYSPPISGSGWLNISPIGGTVSPGTPVNLNVNATVGNLAAGNYTANFVVNNTTNPADTANHTVTVNFAVAPAPTVTPTVTSTPTPTVINTPTVVNTPTPTATDIPLPTAVFTQIPTTTNPSAPTTAGTTAIVNQAPPPVANGVISGHVTLNGNGMGNITLRLNGGNYQQTDNSGYYHFANLAPDTYNLTVLVDQTKYSSSDGLYTRNYTLSSSQTISNADFVLTSGAVSSATTPTPTSPTVVSNTLTPTPIPTTNNAGLPTCTPPPALSGVLSFNYCTSQSSTDSNLFNVTIVVKNNTGDKVDLSHTLAFSLQPGVQIQSAIASVGQIALPSNTGPNNNQLNWSNFQLAPGQSVNLNIYLSKAATSVALITNITVTGIDLALNTSFTSVLPAVLAQVATGQEAIYPLSNTTGGASGAGGGNSNPTVASVPSLPQTGSTAPAANDTNWLAIFIALCGIGLSGVCSVGFVWLKLKRQ